MPKLEAVAQSLGNHQLFSQRHFQKAYRWRTNLTSAAEGPL